jgi:hypothetical protein
MTDGLTEVAAAVQHLQAKLARIGVDVGDWHIQLTKPEGECALRAAASKASLGLVAQWRLPPNVAARINGVDFLQPAR